MYRYIGSVLAILHEMRSSLTPAQLQDVREILVQMEQRIAALDHLDEILKCLPLYERMKRSVWFGTEGV